MLERVPCSRADIFADKRLSLVEKRLLMKVFTSAINFETVLAEEDISPEMSIKEYLTTKCRLPERLTYYVIHSIAMVSETTSVVDGLSLTRNFLKSCNIYGPTPFLWSMYGSAEFPQAFCRLAAVYGAVYVLRSCPVATITDKNGNCLAVGVNSDKRVACKNLVIGSSYCPPLMILNFFDKEPPVYYEVVLRAVLCSDKTLIPELSGEKPAPLNYIRLPSKSMSASIIELPSHTMTCPGNSYLHQISATIPRKFTSRPSLSDIECEVAEFQRILDSYFSFDSSICSEKPNVFWRCIFAVPRLAYCRPLDKVDASDFNVSENIYILPGNLGNGSGLDYDMSIQIAKTVFAKINPDAEEFIPRMPKPTVAEDYTEDIEMPKQESEGISEQPEQPGETDNTNSDKNSVDGEDKCAKTDIDIPSND